MEVTLEGIVTEVKLEQPENAELPMDVTLEGIVTDVKPLQPENAEELIKRTPLGMKKSPVAEFGASIKTILAALSYRALPNLGRL